jgi:TatD DNase family protein
VIVDTHCHLDDPRYETDLEEVLQRAEHAGVNRYIIPGADPQTLERAVEIAEKYASVYFAAGVHPYDAASYRRDELEHYLSHPKCVAVGECGLDYYRLPEDETAVTEEKRLQKAEFLDQIDLANMYQKPLIVHIRDASADSLSLLMEHAGERGGVLHCYNADESLLKLSERSFYYGIGGVVTFKNARKLINVLPKIPMERILIETDAPYLTPHPHRGERNEPAYCTLITQKVAQLRDISYEEVGRVTTENAGRVFGI